MTEDRFEEIMEEPTDFSKESINPIITGMRIINKYLPDDDIWGADYNEIHATQYPRLVAAGITEEDAKALRQQGWYFGSAYEGMNKKHRVLVCDIY